MSYLDTNLVDFTDLDFVGLGGDSQSSSSCSATTSLFEIGVSRPCVGSNCLGKHTLEGVPIQLNPCSFYDEC